MVVKVLGIFIALTMLAAFPLAGQAAVWTISPPAFACGGAASAPPIATPTPAAATPSVGAPSVASPLRPIADVLLPGSATRFDYQSLDPQTGRLFIAHMDANQLVAFDIASNRVAGVIGGIATPTGVLAAPDLGRVFVSETGRHDVVVIDARNLRVTGRTGAIGFPDGLAYAPPAKQVFVSDEAGGGELVIDAATDKAAATIDIGGAAGNTQFDSGSGCVIVAVQDRDRLVAIDPATDRIVGRFDLDTNCRTPHGVLIDAPTRLAYVACEDNSRLVTVDLSAMRTIGAQPVGDSPDVLAFDPGWRILYVASESGVVAMFAARQTNLRPLGDYRAPHAHSVAVDPRTHRAYLPLENVDGKPVLRILAPRIPSSTA